MPALRRPHEQVERATRILVMGSEAFQLPVRGPMPDHLRHVGAILAPAPESPWSPPADDGRPLVLVSLSTLPQGQGPIMRRVLAAVRVAPVRAVVTLGPTLSRETFDVPANVQVEQFVPHEGVLPHVSAVVTQCGLSTITKVLAAGLPMVCLPVLGDQPANAARVDGARRRRTPVEGRVGSHDHHRAASGPPPTRVQTGGSSLRGHPRHREPAPGDDRRTGVARGIRRPRRR